jgi:hypothetical protein
VQARHKHGTNTAPLRHNNGRSSSQESKSLRNAGLTALSTVPRPVLQAIGFFDELFHWAPAELHLKSSYSYAVPRRIADGTPVVLFLNLVPDLHPPGIPRWARHAYTRIGCADLTP